MNYLLRKLFVFLFLLTVIIKADEPKKYSDFKLFDYNGIEHSLSEFSKSKAIVLMFISTQCPVSNAYNQRMAKLYDDFTSAGIAIIGINSNKAEAPEDIKKHADDHNFGFIILKDKGNKIADEFGASFTPEVYVLNKNLELLYHGRIDDSRREEEVQTSDLRNALIEILDGKKVSTNNTKAFGCTIKREN